MLCKVKKEISIDSFVYIIISFWNGRLKQVQLYHHKLNHKHNKEEIQTWLSERGDNYGINHINTFTLIGSSEINP